MDSPSPFPEVVGSEVGNVFGLCPSHLLMAPRLENLLYMRSEESWVIATYISLIRASQGAKTNIGALGFILLPRREGCCGGEECLLGGWAYS